MDCFQKASMFTFKPICQDENNAFWECYKRERVSLCQQTESATSRCRRLNPPDPRHLCSALPSLVTRCPWISCPAARKGRRSRGPARDELQTDVRGRKGLLSRTVGHRGGQRPGLGSRDRHHGTRPRSETALYSTQRFLPTAFFHPPPLSSRLNRFVRTEVCTTQKRPRSSEQRAF